MDTNWTRMYYRKEMAWGSKKETTHIFRYRICSSERIVYLRTADARLSARDGWCVDCHCHPEQKNLDRPGVVMITSWITDEWADSGNYVEQKGTWLGFSLSFSNSEIFCHSMVTFGLDFKNLRHVVHESLKGYKNKREGCGIIWTRFISYDTRGDKVEYTKEQMHSAPLSRYLS